METEKSPYIILYDSYYNHLQSFAKDWHAKDWRTNFKNSKILSTIKMRQSLAKDCSLRVSKVDIISFYSCESLRKLEHIKLN